MDSPNAPVSPRRWPPLARAAFALCAAGGALHLYTALFKADGHAESGVPLAFLAGLFVWSCLPYALWAVLALTKRWFAAAFGGALAALAFDIGMHHAVFIAPKSSTAALGLLFMPLWNLLLGPVGAAMAWGASRLLGRRRP